MEFRTFLFCRHTPSIYISYTSPDMTSCQTPFGHPNNYPTKQPYYQHFLFTDMQESSSSSSMPRMGSCMTGLSTSATYISYAKFQVPTYNPYTLLPDQFLTAMFPNNTSPDVFYIPDHVSWTAEHKRHVLWERDRMNLYGTRSKWSTIEQAGFHKYDADEILFYGIYAGIDYRNIRNYMDVNAYTRVVYVLKQNRDPVVVRGLLNSMNEDIVLAAVYNILPQYASILPLLSKEELVEAVVRNDVTEEQKQLLQYGDKYAIIKRWPQWKLRVYANVGGVQTTDARLLCRIQINPTVETILDGWEKYNPHALMRTFGAIAPYFSNDIEERAQYLNDNIVALSLLISRREVPTITLESLNNEYREGVPEVKQRFYRDMCLLSDDELYTLFQIAVPAVDFSELRSNFLATCISPRFFIPLARTASKIINTETFIGSSTLDTNVPMIAFGHPWSYRLYELDELNDVLGDPDRPDSEDDGVSFFVFRKPENMRDVFSTSEIQSLLAMLRHIQRLHRRGFGVYPERLVSVLAARVELVMMGSRQKEVEDRELLSMFVALSMEQQIYLKQFLENVFYMGMYMRRWIGPDHPYPILEAQTHGLTGKETKLNVSRQVGICYNILRDARADGQNVDDFWRGLQSMTYGGETYIPGSCSLGHLWDGIVTEETCIRVGSSYILGSTSYYLHLFYQTTITSIRGLENIV